MYRKKYSTYRVQQYLWFQILMGVLEHIPGGLLWTAVYKFLFKKEDNSFSEEGLLKRKGIRDSRQRDSQPWANLDMAGNVGDLGWKVGRQGWEIIVKGGGWRDENRSKCSSLPFSLPFTCPWPTLPHSIFTCYYWPTRGHTPQEQGLPPCPLPWAHCPAQSLTPPPKKGAQ